MFDLQMELAANLSEGRPLRKAVHDLCAQAGVADEAASDFLLAISEAFSNAVRYGTTPAHEPIHVRVSVSRVEAKLSLEYAGEPFPQDPPRLPDAHSTGGRGRFLIDRLTDDAQYHFVSGKTRLQLVKRW
jgi:anti-sigma regulatory factor (Ser/Thr protein kinase)